MTPVVFSDLKKAALLIEPYTIIIMSLAITSVVTRIRTSFEGWDSCGDIIVLRLFCPVTLAKNSHQVNSEYKNAFNS
jgi:hypothetical protein